MTDKPMSFVTACSKYFGKKPGQTLADQLAEIKTLTEKDREELAPLLTEALGTPVSSQLYVKD